MPETSPRWQLLPPLAAFGRDFPSDPPDAHAGAVTTWLQTALCLWRIGQLREIERGAAFDAAARTLASAGIVPNVFDAAGDSAAAPDEWRARLASVVRKGAEELESLGAFRLAYSLLAGLRSAIPELSAAAFGAVVVLQGRIARELGDVTIADDHYRLAEQVGRRTSDADLLAKAILGRAVLSVTRGNYPAARMLLRRALVVARRSSLAEHELAAHSCLLMTAVAANDIDGALTHGWHVFTRSADLPGRQAEVLINLAGIALLAGHPESALGASLRAVSLTSTDRLLLAAYGTAALAAARSGRADVLERVTRESLEVIRTSSQHFDKAYTLLELADAHAELSHHGGARELLERSRAIAEPGEFFELLHRAEEVEARLADAVGRRIHDESATSSVIVDASGVATADDSRLSPASRQVIQTLAALRS